MILRTSALLLGEYFLLLFLSLIDGVSDNLCLRPSIISSTSPSVTSYTKHLFELKLLLLIIRCLLLGESLFGLLFMLSVLYCFHFSLAELLAGKHFRRSSSERRWAMQIYAYYVMPSRKLSDVLVLTLNSSQRLPSCIFKKKIFFTARAVDTVLSRSRVYSFFLIQPFRASLTWLSVGFSATELESGDQRSEFLLLPVHATVRLLKDRLSHSLRGDAFLVGPHIGTVRHRPISSQAFPLMRE